MPSLLLCAVVSSASPAMPPTCLGRSPPDQPFQAPRRPLCVVHSAVWSAVSEPSRPLAHAPASYAPTARTPCPRLVVPSAQPHNRGVTDRGGALVSPSPTSHGPHRFPFHAARAPKFGNAPFPPTSALDLAIACIISVADLESARSTTLIWKVPCQMIPTQIPQIVHPPSLKRSQLPDCYNHPTTTEILRSHSSSLYQKVMCLCWEITTTIASSTNNLKRWFPTVSAYRKVYLIT
ncbi:uncharacterized protein [Zea mays]|uniref:uncharacterized protein n=1 Tax=Zea mays TaxID=4577 RepID=UPI0009A95F32|nr:uncharacterized protein LOC103653809 [Zea mays]|eukprot:XP_020408228.1 uncharacterized protein LOC103653809 [Zea mays]